MLHALDSLNAPQLRAVKQGANARMERYEATLHRLEEERARTTRSLGNGHGLWLAKHRRLLAEHGLTRLKRSQRPTQVHGMRKREVDDVNFGVGEERLMGGGPIRAVGVDARRGERRKLLRRAARHGRKLGALNGLEAGREALGNSARTENAPAYRTCFRRRHLCCHHALPYSPRPKSRRHTRPLAHGTPCRNPHNDKGACSC